MIITKKKDPADILSMLKGYDRVFVLGCNSCAQTIETGGPEQVAEMVEYLTKNGKSVTGSAVIDPVCHVLNAKRQLRQRGHEVSAAEAIVVLTCGAGAQTISDEYEQVVIPGLDSAFLGNIVRHGTYDERCSLCGECVLDKTAGVCPVTRCAKGLLNGPCGGMRDGVCEIDAEQPCAWALIYERLDRQRRVAKMREIAAPKDHSVHRKPEKISKR
ncbi:MAG: 5,10-methylenetetrahydrofolate reductase [Actinobacteria bacterium]|nr:MAG: 5,10-methylenetetrahydrofolate reductase [Actinomycetota bacterium]